MAAGALQSVMNSPRGVTRAIKRRSARSDTTNTEIITTALGIAAIAGLIMAATYYTPDLIRYLKIKRM